MLLSQQCVYILLVLNYSQKQNHYRKVMDFFMALLHMTILPCERVALQAALRKVTPAKLQLCQHWFYSLPPFFFYKFHWCIITHQSCFNCHSFYYWERKSLPYVFFNSWYESFIHILCRYISLRLGVFPTFQWDVNPFVIVIWRVSIVY